MTTYTDESVYKLLLEFDPTDAAAITYDDRRAVVEPSSDGFELEWSLLTFPGRGRWREIATGSGNESEMRIQVKQHLRTDNEFN
ncbi:hypothetical protein JNN96_29815 [Mycobacterium sp. DSM 3803]|nr:hypothetical protein [Mycobacterium sp. DSM 3803]